MNPSDPHDILARTVWAEARGDGRRGMEAVACVILNRAAHPRWWGKDVLSVCRAPWQFSCWLPDDPNLPKLKSATGADPSFVTALAVADDALSGRLVDPTGGADSYFAIGTPEPEWAASAVHTCNIIGHAFYRVELGAVPNPAFSGRDSPSNPQKSAENGSVPALQEITSDDLNSAELSSLQGA